MSSAQASAVAARLTALFQTIAGRMAGLPVCNERLTVETVGLREWQGLHLGVLVTPWTFSLVLLPGNAELRRLGADERQRWCFPSGEYDFMGGGDDDLYFQTCSLFSPPDEFPSQDKARDVAMAVLDALLEAVDNTPRQQEAARLAGRPITEQPLTRRGFLKAGGVFSSPR